MDAEFDINEKIDDYLRGKLSRVQQADFEGQMQADPALARQVNLQKLANEIVFTKGLADLKAKISADIASGKAEKKTNWIWTWAIGLGIVALVASWFIFSNKPKPVAFEEIPITIEKAQDNPVKQEISLNKPSETTISHTAPSNVKVQETKMEAGTAAPIAAKEVESEQKPMISSPIPEETKVEHKLEVPAIIEKSKVDCGVKKWHFSLQATPTCAHANDGSIEVIDKTHHQYALGNGNFTTSKSFHHLKKGNYSVSVKDENGCVTTSEVEVYQKNCQENLEVAFNSQLETWKVPIKESNKGEIQIFSKNGRLAFSKQWNQGEEVEWDGKNQNGDLLDRGLYSFTIHYSNGETQQGTISITY